MLRNIYMWILTNVFKVKTETTEKEIDNNKKYALEYERIDEINFSAIFSNKLSNYVINDSTMEIEENNARSILLNKTGQSMWKKMKKITSMGFGYGGVVLVPYVKGGKIYYNLVTQNRLTIDKVDGDNIVGATLLAEKRVITGTISSTTYLRWTNYVIENNNLVITQQFSNDKGDIIAAPEFWKDIQTVMSISNVEKVPFGFIKSPVNNRTANDKYGVPITYGCESTILEIRECLKQIAREFSLKESFVGADVTMFKGDNSLPTNGLYKKVNSGSDDFWEIFNPDIRESSFYARLQELYSRLEKEIGTSAGILTEIKTQDATATAIRKAMYDTFTIVDDMRSNIEKALDDFFYACDVLANAYNLSAMGEYVINYDWDYSLIEDNQEAWNQLVTGETKGIIKKEELRNWIKPTETMEESKMAIDEIKANNPTVTDLIGQ